MSAPEPHPGFPIDDPAAVVADLQGRLDALASRMVDVGQATLGRDPVVMALVDHQRHKPDRCLCGWGELGKSHAEHVAGIIRPLIEAEVREAVAREIEAVRRPGPCPPEYLAGVAWTLVAAARIARGSHA